MKKKYINPKINKKVAIKPKTRLSLTRRNKVAETQKEKDARLAASKMNPQDAKSKKEYDAQLTKLTSDAKKAQTDSDKAHADVLKAKADLKAAQDALDEASVVYEQARQTLALANKAVVEFNESYLLHNQEKVSQ